MSVSEYTHRPSPADYAPRIEGVEFGNVSASVVRDLPEAEWLAALRTTAAMHRRSTWWLGDLLAYGDEKKLSYSEAAAATGLAHGSLRNMAWVSRKVPPERRDPGLHWRTHKVVAPLTADEQCKWLSLALEKGMTSDEVERAIRTAPAGPPTDPEDPIGNASVCPLCHGTGTLDAAV